MFVPNRLETSVTMLMKPDSRYAGVHIRLYTCLQNLKQGGDFSTKVVPSQGAVSEVYTWSQLLPHRWEPLSPLAPCSPLPVVNLIVSLLSSAGRSDLSSEEGMPCRPAAGPPAPSLMALRQEATPIQRPLSPLLLFAVYGPPQSISLRSRITVGCAHTTTP